MPYVHKGTLDTSWPWIKMCIALTFQVYIGSLMRRVLLRKIGEPALCLYISGSDHMPLMF